MIAIISPATTVKPEYINKTVELLRSEGLKVMVMPHALGPASGTYAASLTHRLADWLAAWKDPHIDTIFCSRGGYGCVQLAANTPIDLVKRERKTVVGFSDVTALHALMHFAGVPSIHAPMVKHLALEGLDDPATRALIRLFKGGAPTDITAAPHPLNRSGSASGMLLGGNLAVMNSLAATQLDMLAEPLRRDTILFIEDIREPLYALDRMLWRLHLTGALRAAKGLIFGHFTDSWADPNYPDAPTMIADRLSLWGCDIPVAFGFPVGHERENMPLIEGARVTLTVDATGTKLSFVNSL